MQFNTENNIVRLCAEGMDLEGSGNGECARQLFLQAWEEAVSDFERFTAAHYVARHQPDVRAKLEWDRTALDFALKLGEEAGPALSSLYLNIAKCYEDLQEREAAILHYELALSAASHLGDDGYAAMIRSGIQNGLGRMSVLSKEQQGPAAN